MVKMIKEWKTGCASFLGNVIYNAADKKLKSEYRGILLTLVMDFVLSLFIVVKMWPINSFGRLAWLLFLLYFAFVVSACAADDIMVKLMTALMRKYEPCARLYSRRKKERKMRKAARRAAGKRKKEKERTGQKEVQKERKEWEKAQRERAEQEKAQRAREEQEKAQRARAERENSQRERAEREKAQREREERAREERRKQEQRAGQISSVQQARQLLRMKESYTKEDLKKARNALMKEFHPDNKGRGDEELCKKINAAYALLSKYAKAA